MSAKLARAEHASLVVCGHSHVPFIGQDKGITVFNPGSIGPRRFSLADRVRHDRGHADRRAPRARQLRDRRGVEPAVTTTGGT